ncbi:hypothetical protein WMY93_024300 [Mugilogobius chulae]|uniref:RRM domain-containing protein n=1 Tax=Mugilogobius chulae TaxID=88201 RepID=A0AAW0N9K8_9GOBI
MILVDPPAAAAAEVGGELFNLIRFREKCASISICSSTDSTVKHTQREWEKERKKERKKRESKKRERRKKGRKKGERKKEGRERERRERERRKREKEERERKKEERERKKEERKNGERKNGERKKEEREKEERERKKEERKRKKEGKERRKRERKRERRKRERTNAERERKKEERERKIERRKGEGKREGREGKRKTREREIRGRKETGARDKREREKKSEEETEKEEKKNTEGEREERDRDRKKERVQKIRKERRERERKNTGRKETGAREREKKSEGETEREGREEKERDRRERENNTHIHELGGGTGVLTAHVSPPCYNVIGPQNHAAVTRSQMVSLVFVNSQYCEINHLAGQRGSDELLSSVSNGPYIMSTTVQSRDARRRGGVGGGVGGVGSPSRVLHIRRLPTDVTEAEVIGLGLPFGDVSNLLMLKAKNQRAQAALRALSSSHLDPVAPPPSAVLRVVVENMVCAPGAVTMDTLYQVKLQTGFSKFGTVLRIIVFTKNSQFQALLQYSDGQAAQAAKVLLDGQNLYNGCCTLRISFSKLTALDIKFNNERSRDFTRPDLPSGDTPAGMEHPAAMATAFTPGLIPAAPYPTATHAFPHAFTIQPTVSSYPGLVPALPGALTSLSLPAASRLGFTTLLQQTQCCWSRVTPHCLFILFGVYGDVMRVKILFNKKENALVQMADATQAQLRGPRGPGPDQGLQHLPLHRFKKPGSKNYSNIFPRRPRCTCPIYRRLWWRRI